MDKAYLIPGSLFNTYSHLDAEAINQPAGNDPIRAAPALGKGATLTSVWGLNDDTSNPEKVFPF